MDDVQALRQEILLRANDLYEKREYARAAEVAQELLTVLPEDAEMRYILAAALTQTEAYDAARAEVARIRAVCPDHAGAARQEVYIDRAEGRLATEIAHLRALIDMLKRRMAEEEERRAHDAVFLASAYSLLGSALTEAGEAQEAVAAFLASAQLETERAQRAVEYSNALFAVNYLPTHLRPAYAGLARVYDALFADVLPRAEAADAVRGHARIRIGYISPDLCVHPVGRLVRPLLTQYDRTQFAVHCYARCAEDALSETFRAAVDVWHNIRALSAAEAAALIRRDAARAYRIALYFASDERNHPIQMTLSTLFGFFSNLMAVYYIAQPNERSIASLLGVQPFVARDYDLARRGYSAAQTFAIIHQIRLIDAYSKGVDANIPTSQLYSELVSRILAA